MKRHHKRSSGVSAQNTRKKTLRLQPSTLERVYSSIWMRFDTACGALLKPHSVTAGKGVKMNCLEDQSTVVEISSAFCLPSWPYRSSQSSDKVDILVRTAERVDCSRSAVVKSSVGVLYLEPSTGHTTRPLLGLHYDFSEDEGGSHPVFHAQLGNISFTQRECEAMGYRKHIDPPIMPMYGKARIPTPHIGLCSILLCLAADHLDPSQYVSFLDDVRTSELLALKLDVACGQTRQKVACQNGTYLMSHHWYSSVLPDDVTSTREDARAGK